MFANRTSQTSIIDFMPQIEKDIRQVVIACFIWHLSLLKRGKDSSV